MGESKREFIGLGMGPGEEDPQVLGQNLKRSLKEGWKICGVLKIGRRRYYDLVRAKQPASAIQVTQ